VISGQQIGLRNELTERILVPGQLGWPDGIHQSGAALLAAALLGK
jgi:hypothetical protein